MKIIDFQNIAIEELKQLITEDSNCRERKPVDFNGQPSAEQLEEEVGLNVRACFLKSLAGIGEFAAAVLYNPINLVYADFSCNKITSVAGIEQFVALRVLYLQGNDIANVREIDFIAQLPELHSLKLHGNPVILYSNFRQYCIAIMQNLRSLDGVHVTQNERKEVAVLCQNKMIQLKKRENVVLRK